MASATRERTVYEAGAGRKTFLSLAFLILLPFYASLGPMLAWRFTHGLWFDTVGLIVFSLIFTALMALLGVQIYHAIRSRVVLGESAVRITLPQGSGAMPMLRFVDKEVPYDQIQGVETRCVLFGNVMAPVLLRATRLLTKDGEKIRLGTVNEDNVDPALPFPEIGAKIAERAGVDIIDAGTVRRSIERRVLGLIGSQDGAGEQPAPERNGDTGPAAPSQASDALSCCCGNRTRAGRHCSRFYYRAEDLICDRGRPRTSE